MRFVETAAREGQVGDGSRTQLTKVRGTIASSAARPGTCDGRCVHPKIEAVFLSPIPLIKMKIQAFLLDAPAPLRSSRSSSRGRTQTNYYKPTASTSCRRTLAVSGAPAGSINVEGCRTARSRNRGDRGPGNTRRPRKLARSPPCSRESWVGQGLRRDSDRNT